MSRRLEPGRRFEDERPASVLVSRLLVAGFLIAALLGLMLGAISIGSGLTRAWFGH